MADKAIVDKAISDLTQALQIANEDLFVLEQNGEAKKLKGETLLDFVTLSVVSVTVTTLPAGSEATASMSGATEAPLLNLGIPKGDKGDKGSPGSGGGGGSGYITDVSEDFDVSDAGRLSLTKAEQVQADNTHPITAAAVYVEVGNINALLGTI